MYGGGSELLMEMWISDKTDSAPCSQGFLLNQPGWSVTSAVNWLVISGVPEVFSPPGFPAAMHIKIGLN